LGGPGTRSAPGGLDPVLRPSAHEPATADVSASNGVIHVIDTVLLPE